MNRTTKLTVLAIVSLFAFGGLFTQLLRNAPTAPAAPIVSTTTTRLTDRQLYAQRNAALAGAGVNLDEMYDSAVAAGSLNTGKTRCDFLPGAQTLTCNGRTIDVTPSTNKSGFATVGPAIS